MAKEKAASVKKGIIIGVYNRKGGVGKTTSVINIGACLAMKKKKVLLIDGDSQINLSKFFLRENELFYDDMGAQQDGISNIYDMLSGDCDVIDCIYELNPSYERQKRKLTSTGKFKLTKVTTSCSMDLMLGSSDMVYFSEEQAEVFPDRILSLRDEYDYIIVEFPPSFNLATMSYLSVTDYLVVPLMVGEKESMDGYLDLVGRVEESIENGGHCQILGAFYTFVRNNWRSHAELIEMNESTDLFFKSTTRYISTVINNAKEYGLPVCVFAPDEQISKDYANLTSEIVKRIGKAEKANGK